MKIEEPSNQRNFSDLRRVGTTESTQKAKIHDTLELQSYLGEVDKQMREMEERIHKHMEHQFEAINFNVLELKLKQDQSATKTQSKSGLSSSQPLDPKKLETALNDWLQKVEV